MSAAVPPGWTLTKKLEEVPNPNFGTPYGQNYFVRWTYIAFWALKNLTVASGDEQDAANQAWAVYESGGARG